MKYPKLTFTALLFAVCFAMSAQDRPQMPEEQRQEIVNLMQENKERLALKPEQEEPFKEVSTRYYKEYRAVKNGTEGQTQKFRKVKELQTQKDAEMKKLLDETQYATYLIIQQERRDKAQGKR
jgi:cytochrome c556